MRRPLMLAALLLLSTLSFASGGSTKPGNGTVVDEGTFAIFQSGQQLGTEKFSVVQYGATNVTTADLHSSASSDSKGALEQQASLTLRPDGALVRYEWKQLAPRRSSAVVEPSKEILTMHINDDGKVVDEPYFLTPSSFILDDYFFISREILLWRYLATSCVQRQTGDGCDLVRARYPVLVPHRRTSSEAYISFKGYEDTPLNGRPQRLRHFIIETSGLEWHLWLDQNHKLLRISIPAAGTEVLRQ